MARGFLTGRARREGSAPTERLHSDEYAQKIYGRANDAAVAEAVEAVAVERKVVPAQVALAWTLSRPGMTAPIFGATRPEHVDAAVAALDIALDAEALQRVSQAYEPRPAASLIEVFSKPIDQRAGRRKKNRETRTRDQDRWRSASTRAANAGDECRRLG
jgi:hypothetical protein